MSYKLIFLLLCCMLQPNPYVVSSPSLRDCLNQGKRTRTVEAGKEKMENLKKKKSTSLTYTCKGNTPFRSAIYISIKASRNLAYHADPVQGRSPHRLIKAADFVWWIKASPPLRLRCKLCLQGYFRRKKSINIRAQSLNFTRLDPVIYRIAFCPEYVNLQSVLYLFLSEWQPRILPAHGCTLGLGYYMNCNTLKPLNPRLRRANLHAQSPLSLFLSFTAGHEASLLPGVWLLASMWAGLCSPRTKVGAKRELVSLPEPPGSESLQSQFIFM